MTDYTPPTPDQVREFLRAHNLSGAQAAALAGLSGSNKIRAYTGGADPARMGYAVWFTLHAKTMLPPDVVAQIDSEMGRVAGRADVLPDRPARIAVPRLFGQS